MSKEVTEDMELPVTCNKSQLHGNGDPETKLETQENEQNKLTTDTSPNSRSENYHEQIVVSAGSMQMQLVDTPDSEVTETELRNDDLMSTQFVSTAGSEKSYPNHAGIFSAKSNSTVSVTQGQAVALKGRPPIIKNAEIPSVGESHVSHDNDVILEQFALTGNKIENFLMSASSYETSTARSLQLTSQMCSLPRQMKIRTDLSLSDKVRLIQVSEKTGKSQRSLAAEFGISLGSVNNILRRKREYIEAFERNEVSGSIKSFRRVSWPSCSRTRSPAPKVNETDSLNRLMYKWVETAKKKNVILSSTLLQDKASEFASKLGISSFTPTNSWVNTLKNQFNLCFENDNDSTGKLYTTWTKMLPYLIQGYEPQNVFTCGETTLIYRGLPDKCLVEGGMCMGTHHRTESSNHSVTLLLCCSAVGEKIKPLVIGKSGMRNSFQNVAPGNLPVVWKHQDKACMTSSLFTEWLKDLDRCMEQQNRHIALFMDMAPGHLSNLLLRNVRLQFYLDNSSSYLQPLQQGILTSFKAHYRKRFLQAVLAWAECCDSSPHVVNNVTELDVVFWIKHAWNSVKKGLVINCFDAVGFPTPPPLVEEDANDGLSLQLSELVEECGQAFKFTPMHAKMYVEFDSQIPCHVHETELWEQQLLAEAMTGSITIKSEPIEEDFQYGGRGRLLPLDGQSSQTEGTVVTRPISQSEALESLNKLKTFAASDPSLLETLYATEEEMLDSISSHRQQARCRAMNNLFPLNVYQHGIL
ncbi:tigger transposable element-derived protein 4-like [Gigantopelta aegis]|uniref:tigger transposable element-derived protein 4-like n=1 Tax=Gigantopelta aegis TaxID=1735272 RepID=UPI001B8888D3|nr:tigger transposable element-derived protein 4-like [Gigantopelta aegis]